MALVQSPKQIPKYNRISRYHEKDYGEMWVSSVGTPHGAPRPTPIRHRKFQAGWGGTEAPRDPATGRALNITPASPPDPRQVGRGGEGQLTGSDPPPASLPGSPAAELGRKGRAEAEAGRRAGPPPPDPRTAAPAPGPRGGPGPGPPDPGPARADSRRRPCPPAGRRDRARPPGHFLPPARPARLARAPGPGAEEGGLAGRPRRKPPPRPHPPASSRRGYAAPSAA